MEGHNARNAYEDLGKPTLICHPTTRKDSKPRCDLFGTNTLNLKTGHIELICTNHLPAG